MIELAPIQVMESGCFQRDRLERKTFTVKSMSMLEHSALHIRGKVKRGMGFESPGGDSLSGKMSPAIFSWVCFLPRVAKFCRMGSSGSAGVFIVTACGEAVG